MTDFSLEDLLNLEGIDYRESMGNKGLQLNIKECPRCGKDGWKVYANADSGLGNCFSCELKFNIFSFVRELLIGRGGVGVTNQSVGKYLNDCRKKLGYRPKKSQAKIETTIITTEDVELPYSQKLPYTDGWLPPYLLSRGIDGHYASMFDLRFSAFGTWSYKDSNGETHKQNFSNRILIPVYDLEGKLVTFQGRDTTGESDMRYKFAGGLPGTARYLYNGHVALQKKSKRIIMAEGVFDVIGIQKMLDQFPEFDDTTPVGSWGKHLSKIANSNADQVTAFSTLKRGWLREVIIVYDGEVAAYTEALKAAEIISEIGIKASVAILPKDVDPGEADTHTLYQTIKDAIPYTRITALRMKMNNPYS